MFVVLFGVLVLLFVVLCVYDYTIFGFGLILL